VGTTTTTIQATNASVELQLLHLHLTLAMQLVLQGRGQREGILRVVAAGQFRVSERLHYPVRDKLHGLQRRAEAVKVSSLVLAN
jgi:hypothetical protein